MNVWDVSFTNNYANDWNLNILLNVSSTNQNVSLKMKRRKLYGTLRYKEINLDTHTYIYIYIYIYWRHS